MFGNLQNFLGWSGGLGGTDPAVITRLDYLENNENYYIYFAEISGTTGTITIPTGAQIVLDQFTDGADAYCTTIINGKSTLEFPKTSGGVAVDVATFDALGNFTLTGTPSSYPVALVYILKIKSKFEQNLNEDYIVEVYPIDELSDKLDKPSYNIVASAATFTLDLNLYNRGRITALASAITIANPTGTPYDGQQIMYEIRDNGTARAFTAFGSDFNFSTDLAAPTTTVINRWIVLGFQWNATISKWVNLAQLNNLPQT